jgi:hypothetical protein
MVLFMLLLDAFILAGIVVALGVLVGIAVRTIRSRKNQR